MWPLHAMIMLTEVLLQVQQKKSVGGAQKLTGAALWDAIPADADSQRWSGQCS
jgi:hypothetical protein